MSLLSIIKLSPKYNNIFFIIIQDFFYQNLLRTYKLNR